MLDYRIGIIGTPAVPDVKWTTGALTELKKYGFNMLQLNIAWGYRPNNEPLNLQDVLILPGQTETERKKAHFWQKELTHRLKLCKEHNMRSLFHFGAPYNGVAPYHGFPPEICFNTAETKKYYCMLLEKLDEQIPGIDDILVYTYDQDAWLCSEFSDCRNCRAIPLHKRLPSFLSALCAEWAEINPNGRMWWEPWELSAGQTFFIIEQISNSNFGLMLHSNIGEVQKVSPVDVWFKNVCTIALEKGIPVVAELFLGESSEETEPLKRIPCPELTYRQIQAVLNQDGVKGIKEYYGLLPQTVDPCLEMAGQVLHHPEYSLNECLNYIAEKYSPYKDEMIHIWELITKAYMFYPWDVSWYAREVGRAETAHGWHAAFLRGQQCSTPSWESSRHAVFMKTDNIQPHPWMLEDIELRCKIATEYLQQALTAGNTILDNRDIPYFHQLDETMQSIEKFMRICFSYALHIRETNVSMLIRDNITAGENSDILLKELRSLLDEDMRNQHCQGQIVNILKEFDDDPYEWLNTYLLPTDIDLKEKGKFTLTTR